MQTQDGHEVYMDSYMAFMFRDHLNYFKNHLLEVGLTQNRETTALQTLMTVVRYPYG